MKRSYQMCIRWYTLTQVTNHVSAQRQNSAVLKSEAYKRNVCKLLVYDLLPL